MQDLGSHVYSTNQDWETQEKRDNMYYSLRKNPVEGLGGVASHFYGIHRGARILRFKREGREFSMTLEDWWLSDFLHHVAIRAKVNAPEVLSQVSMHFHDVAYQTTLAARPDGVVRFYRYDEPTGHDRLHRDWFFRQDGRLQWIAELDVYGKGRGMMTVGPFIVVDCLSVSVQDERELRIREAVSNELAQMWSEFWTNGSAFKLSWPPLSDQAAFEMYLEERGWTVNQLFPS